LSDNSAIEWTNASWNPVRGCDKVSAGCKHCYAERVAERWRGIKGHPFEQGFDLRLVPESLDKPLRWKRLRKIFVNSMSDLFHEDIPNEYIAAVWGVMAACPQHTFQVLTKRAARMRDWFAWISSRPTQDGHARITEHGVMRLGLCTNAPTAMDGPWKVFSRWAAVTGAWPLPNVHVGISAENQECFDERWPYLKDCPAAVRWVSLEPLLGPIDLSRALYSAGPDGEPAPRNLELDPGLDWAVAGGESGPHFREMDPTWAKDLARQCQEAGVPFFMKQDSGLTAGRQGRLSDELFTIKEFPRSLPSPAGQV
jgi:protein gp37